MSVTVATRKSAARDVRQAVSQIADSVVAGDPEALTALERLTGSVAGGGDAESVSSLRLLLGRLARRSEPSLGGVISGLDQVLEGALERLDADRATRRLAERRAILRERVLEMVRSADEPLRPSMLADACDADIYQVSHVLRSLKDDELVIAVNGPKGGDGRGTWYRLLDASDAAAEEQHAIHAQLSQESHDTWHRVASEAGVSVAGLLEALAADLNEASLHRDQEQWTALLESARKFDLERRR